MIWLIQRDHPKKSIRLTLVVSTFNSNFIIIKVEHRHTHTELKLKHNNLLQKHAKTTPAKLKWSLIKNQPSSDANFLFYGWLIVITYEYTLKISSLQSHSYTFRLMSTLGYTVGTLSLCVVPARTSKHSQLSCQISLTFRLRTDEAFSPLVATWSDIQGGWEKRTTALHISK